MDTPQRTPNASTAIHWFICGFEGAFSHFQSLIQAAGCVDPSELERLERISDRFADLVKDQKQKSGISPEIKTY